MTTITTEDWKRLSWHQRQRVLRRYAAAKRPKDRSDVRSARRITFETMRAETNARVAERNRTNGAPLRKHATAVGVVNRAKILDVLALEPAATIWEIRRRTGLSERTVQRHLAAIRGEITT